LVVSVNGVRNFAMDSLLPVTVISAANGSAVRPQLGGQASRRSFRRAACRKADQHRPSG